MSVTFTSLGISEMLTNGMRAKGITLPTAIQERVIPLALAGKDVIGQSPTGTGKTLAYLLPLFQKIDTGKREMQALILAPTHELAIQIEREIEQLARHSAMPVTSTPIIGDVNIARQIDKLKEKPHIIVGSSGRILELIQKRKISAHTIRTIIIDEADRLLDDKNLPGVKAVIKTTLKERQLLLFSATITAQTLARAQEFMNQPQKAAVTDRVAVAPDISHLCLYAEQRDKIELLRKLVALISPEQALVFINRSHDIENVVAKLAFHGLKVAGIYGSSVKLDRQKSLEDFRNGKAQVLVASDLAARGLDVPGVAYIFNLDIPEDPQVYLHRVGRTGRAGQSGTAVSIVAAWEIGFLEQYEKDLKINIAAKQLSGGRMMNAPKQKAKEKAKT